MLFALNGPLAAATGNGTMDSFTQWILNVMETLGAPGAALLVALENIFPPIPSEVILPLAGFTASLGTLGLVEVIVWTTIGSLVGAWALYALGVILGRDRLFRFFDWMPLVDVEDIEKAESWFVKYGTAVVFFGRMIPLIRSLISIPAGLERMPIVKFSIFTTLGSALWNSLLVYAGYLLGENWQVVGTYVGYFSNVIKVIIVVAVVAYLIYYFRKRSRKRAAAQTDSHGTAAPHADEAAPSPGATGATATSAQRTEGTGDSGEGSSRH